MATAVAAAAAGAITLHGCTSQHIASFVLDEFFDLVSVSILYYCAPLGTAVFKLYVEDRIIF